jgi:hypothetical protein
MVPDIEWSRDEALDVAANRPVRVADRLSSEQLRGRCRLGSPLRLAPF